MCALRHVAAVHPHLSRREEQALTKVGPVAGGLAFNGGPFRQRGPDDERMNELEPLRLVLGRSIHPVVGDAASGISKGERASEGERAEPSPMRTAGTHLGSRHLGRAGMPCWQLAHLDDIYAACPPVCQLT